MIKKMLPIVEGKCPPVRRMNRDGTWEMYYPKERKYKDPNAYETNTHIHTDKEEFYGYVTVCKSCGVSFIAYNPNYDEIKNYCPGCGMKLQITEEGVNDRP